MSNSEVDNNSNGANILLIVIISIICINLLMIYEILFGAKKKAYGSRAKHLILILQGIGDICIGLFPLNIRLQGMIDNPSMENIVCWQRILAHTFLFYLMPFVHATGNIVLIAESFLFWGRHGVHPSPCPERNWFTLRYLLASLIPWGLGVLTVIPLVLVGFDFKTCSVQDYSSPRLQSFYWVTIVLPGVLAVIAACAYMLSSLSTSSQLLNSTNSSLTHHSSAHSRCYSENHLPSYSEALQTSADNMYTSLDIIGCIKPNMSEKFYDFFNANEHFCHYRTGYTERGKLLNDGSIQGSDKIFVEGEGQGGILHGTVENIQSTIRWEKWNRVAVVILFCICSMPSAILDIIFLSKCPDGSWPDFTQLSSGIEALYRLHVLRSLISPIVWINEYS